MPQELPGFYYDTEKNRYFPIRGPIPGSTSSTNVSSCAAADKKFVSKLKQVNKIRRGIRTTKLVQARELYGNVITSRKGRFKFEVEYQKAQASRPQVWKYCGTEIINVGALEQVRVDLDSPAGQTEEDVLLAGGANGSLLGLYDVQKVRRELNRGIVYEPRRVLPNSFDDRVWPDSPSNLWNPAGALTHRSSDISCIKAFQDYPPGMIGNASSMRRVLFTTLGSESSGGSVCILNLREPIDYTQRVPLSTGRTREITTLSCTIWSADCRSDMNKVAVGTNVGAALINTETGRLSWICRCRSDILSLQIVDCGKVVLCGMRNGSIVTVDTRQKPDSCRLTRHRVPYFSSYSGLTSSQASLKHTKRWFELKGCIQHSRTISMPSSISCLASLKLYDQYFLASSMDGSIELYDHRLIQKGAVQSYLGNVNSHTRLQLGIDPSEKFVMSGGEDCYLRLWSIKSGELLFENKFMESIPSIICWPRTEDLVKHSWNAWLRSHEGIFYVRSPD